MSLLDINETKNDRLTDIKIWLENNIVYPDNVREYEKRNYTDYFFQFIKKGNKYYVNVKNGNIIFKDDCEEVPHKLFEFYSVNGGVNINKVKNYKGFPKIVSSLQIRDYADANYSSEFGPSVVQHTLYIINGVRLYTDNLKYNELYKKGNKLPLYINNIGFEDEFYYKMYLNDLKDKLYINKISKY